MEYQSLFSGKNKKNVSKCHLLSHFPSMLSVNVSRLAIKRHLKSIQEKALMAYMNTVNVLKFGTLFLIILP